MTILNLMVYRHSAFYSPVLSAIAGGFLAHEGFEATYRSHAGEIQVSPSAVSASGPFVAKKQ
jgi:hypothetical protein